MKLSIQAVGAIMMAIQKSLLLAAEEKDCDMTELLMEYELQNSPDGLVVTNPHVIKSPIETSLENDFLVPGNGEIN
ncbi:hypothetical protein M0R19_04435 [Candidatus Pacearchaeota archaeon]|jgi:hypothetical protein|nr:hypothetical protein [Candidatus Pacearchaeota archaeon]